MIRATIAYSMCAVLFCTSAALVADGIKTIESGYTIQCKKIRQPGDCGDCKPATSCNSLAFDESK